MEKIDISGELDLSKNIDLSRGLDILTCSELEFYNYYDIDDIDDDQIEEDIEILYNYEKNSCINFKLGYLYYRINNEGESKEYFQKCMDSSWGYLGMHILNYENKIEYLEKALELDNNNVIVFQRLGHFFLCENNIDKAIEYYEKAAEQNDTYSIDSLSTIYTSKYYKNYNFYKGIKYRKILLKNNIISKEETPSDIFFLEMEKYMFEENDKLKEKNKELEDMVSSLKLELSLIPGYGELYKEAKINFESNINMDK